MVDAFLDAAAAAGASEERDAALEVQVRIKHALYACLVCMPSVHALYACLISMPHTHVVYTCLISMPYKYAICVCLIRMPYMRTWGAGVSSDEPRYLLAAPAADRCVSI